MMAWGFRVGFYSSMILQKWSYLCRVVHVVSQDLEIFDWRHTGSWWWLLDSGFSMAWNPVQSEVIRMDKLFSSRQG